MNKKKRSLPHNKRNADKKKSLSEADLINFVDALNFSDDIPAELEVPKSGFKSFNEFDRIDRSLFLLLLLLLNKDEFKSNGFFLTNNDIAYEIDWAPYKISLMLGMLASVGFIRVAFEPVITVKHTKFKRRIQLTEHAQSFLKTHNKTYGTTYLDFYAYWHMVKDVPLDFDYFNQ